MQIIKCKSYEIPEGEEKENKILRHVSYNSNGTLSLVMTDGTHYNFIDKEFRKIVEFIQEKIRIR